MHPKAVSFQGNATKK